MNPPRSMPSCEKIHPPSTAPTSPSKTFAMQPKPRPRETFPASQPAMRPTSSHPIKVRGTVKKKRCMECSFSGKLQLAPARALRGFLLRHAVYRTQTENQIETCNSDNCAARKQISKLSEGHGVIRVVKRRYEHNLIRNIKISVARGKPLPIEIHDRGHGQCFNAQHVAVLIFHLAKQRQILLQRLVIRLGRIFFNYGHHRRGIHKARQIVHVAVRVVPSDTVLEPQNVRHAEKVSEDFFQFLAYKPWIARLHRTQQAFLRCEQRTAAVYVDAASLDHHAPPAKLGTPLLPLELRSEPVVRGVILLPIVILRPCIEMPIRNPSLTFFVPHKYRPKIPNPSAICGNVKEIHARKIRASLFQNPANGPFRARVRNKYPHAFHLRQVPHNIRIDPWNGREFPRPVRFFMGPRKPGGRVRLPLRWHPVAEPEGCGLHSCHRFKMGA